MKKIIDYTLFSGYEDEMKRMCKNLVNMGWQPFGGISSCQYGRGTILSQAFVKYEEDDNDDKS